MVGEPSQFHPVWGAIRELLVFFRVFLPYRLLDTKWEIIKFDVLSTNTN